MSRRMLPLGVGESRRFSTREEVDFVVVGSGAAGGVMARELSRAGYSVVVLEQGPYIRPFQFRHDEFAHFFGGELMGSPAEFPTTFRRTASEKAEVPTQLPAAVYARLVGGSSVHFTANYWRFRPVDFQERSLLGEIPGTGFADWPITYDELEPYYSKVEWDVGVSGAPGPDDPHRSRPFPHPPLPVKSSGVLLERGARALGWTVKPAPMAILSEPRAGRAACGHCGFCMMYGCEFSAKSSTLATMIPEAERTGRCEIRPESTVFRVETDARGRVKEVRYFDAGGVEHAQSARAVVLCANGAETPRLLLDSESSLFPHGLANGSGRVGKYLMFNGNGTVRGLFDEPLNEFKSVQVTRICQEWYDADPTRGFYGGGGVDGRYFGGPIFFGLGGLPPDAPTWGSGYKEALQDSFTRCMDIATHSTSLALDTNDVTLDPEVKDRFGRRALRITYKDHPDDVRMVEFLQDRAVEILEAAGARQVWAAPVVEQSAGFHLLGTCRMGDDPDQAVVDRYHRTHEVPNLFICDGSSFVTSGRGQPTMTIQALAFRAAEAIGGAAARGEI